MIANKQELHRAVSQIEDYKQALEALRESIAESNPALFAVASVVYADRIGWIEEEVACYLAQLPPVLFEEEP